MVNRDYDENYLNKFVIEHEDGEIAEVKVNQQKYILTDGSTFKCHIHEIDDTMYAIADSFSDEEVE